MNIVLCSREDESRALSHGLVLCTPEEAEEYLMHYRTEGSKNGQRLYQYKDGSLTPLGRIHYGVGKGRRAQEKADKYQKKAEKAKSDADRAQLKYDKAVLKSRRRPDDPGRQAKVNAALGKLSKAKYLASKYQVKANKLSDKVEKAVEKEEKGKQKLEEDRKRWEQDKETVSQESENKEPAKKEYDKFELSDMARTEFNGNKEHDDALRDVPKDVIKDRIRLTRDWFNDEEYVTKEERETSLKYAVEHIDDYRGKSEALKNLGDDLLSYVKEKSDEIDNKINPNGKWDSKAYRQMKESHEYDTYDQLQKWLTDQVYDKSGSMNADEYKPGSNAAKVYDSESFKKVRDETSKRYDEISKKTGYSFGNNYKKLIEACKKDSVWQKLDKEYQKHESDLLGAILKDIGFRDTPENRYIIYQFAFID